MWLFALINTPPRESARPPWKNYRFALYHGISMIDAARRTKDIQSIKQIRRQTDRIHKTIRPATRLLTARSKNSSAI